MASITQYGTGTPITTLVRPTLDQGYRDRLRTAGETSLAEARRALNNANALLRILRAAEPYGQDDCWEWQGNKANGYGQVAHHGKNRRVHRVAFELLVGPVPEGLVIDHLCHNRACFNPRHLEPVTQAVNLSRSTAVEAARAIRKSQTHCKRGHPLSGDNLRTSNNGHRRCLTCIRASANAGYHRRKEQANV